LYSYMTSHEHALPDSFLVVVPVLVRICMRSSYWIVRYDNKRNTFVLEDQSICTYEFEFVWMEVLRITNLFVSCFLFC
jgi:hypothetical protein